MKYSDRKNRQRLYLYTHISYISYTYPIDLHITLVVPSRQCLFTYYEMDMIIFFAVEYTKCLRARVAMTRRRMESVAIDIILLSLLRENHHASVVWNWYH